MNGIQAYDRMRNGGKVTLGYGQGWLEYRAGLVYDQDGVVINFNVDSDGWEPWVCIRDRYDKAEARRLMEEEGMKMCRSIWGNKYIFYYFDPLTLDILPGHIDGGGHCRLIAFEGTYSQDWIQWLPPQADEEPRTEYGYPMDRDLALWWIDQGGRITHPESETDTDGWHWLKDITGVLTDNCGRPIDPNEPGSRMAEYAWYPCDPSSEIYSDLRVHRDLTRADMASYLTPWSLWSTSTPELAGYGLQPPAEAGCGMTLTAGGSGGGSFTVDVGGYSGDMFGSSEPHRSGRPPGAWHTYQMDTDELPSLHQCEEIHYLNSESLWIRLMKDGEYTHPPFGRPCMYKYKISGE